MENIIEYYKGYDEEGRLQRDNVHRIEWLTTIRYLEKYIKPNSLILDGCAGTGNYAFKLAELGHKVIASDIVPHNVDIIGEKQRANPVLKDYCVNDVTNLSTYSDETFDVVLCMGAFYHLGENERNRAMKECLRVLKKMGILVISYINNMAVTLMGLGNAQLTVDSVVEYHKNKSRDDLFYYMTANEMEDLAENYNTNILAHIGADGINYMISSKINRANDDDLKKLLELHYSTCEDKSLLGYSLHGLIILEKK